MRFYKMTTEFPTHVGMNREEETQDRDAVRVPHACGDEPVRVCTGREGS